MGFPPKAYQFLVGTFAALGSFLYGYDLTIVAEGKLSHEHESFPRLFIITDNPGFRVLSGI